jgi:hypothetical protein
MDITAIQTLIGSLKTAADVAKALFDMKTSADVQSKVSEMQHALLAAKNSALSATTAQFELQEKIRQLEAQIKAFNDWEAQKSRYSLVAPWKGPAQAYALKESQAQGEEPHLLCANCFHSSKRVILNPMQRDGFIIMGCPSCRATLDTGYRGIGGARYAERYAEKG